MSEDHLNDISLQDTMIELNILLALAATLSRHAVPDEELQHFDDLSAFMRERGVSLVEASQATAVPVTRGVMVIVLLGLIHNWWKGGADAAIALPEPDELDRVMTSQPAPEHDELPLLVKAVRAMGFAHVVDGRDYWVELGEIMQELADVVLLSSDIETELGVQIALATYDLLTACRHEGAALSQVTAYRLLVWSKRLPFLADLAPSKFPPPIAPHFSRGDQLDFALTFFQQGVLDQPLDLGVNARDMVEDPDAVIDNDAEVEINGIRQALRFELTFGPAMLAWALDDESEESVEFGADADLKLRMMLDLCCRNQVFLERHRDEDLFDIYTMAYIGTEPASERRLGLVLKIETMGHMMRCILGLSEEDVGKRGVYGQVAVRHEALLMAHLEATIRSNAPAAGMHNQGG